MFMTMKFDVWVLCQYTFKLGTNYYFYVRSYKKLRQDENLWFCMIVKFNVGKMQYNDSSSNSDSVIKCC